MGENPFFLLQTLMCEEWNMMPGTTAALLWLRGVLAGGGHTEGQGRKMEQTQVMDRMVELLIWPISKLTAFQTSCQWIINPFIT